MFSGLRNAKSTQHQRRHKTGFDFVIDNLYLQVVVPSLASNYVLVRYKAEPTRRAIIYQQFEYHEPGIGSLPFY